MGQRAPASAPINYYSRASYEKLALVQGDGDVFAHLMKLLSEYEVRWADIIHHARSNPTNFSTVVLPGGGRICRFTLKGVQVEVSEDDWRLIATGAMNNLIPQGPTEEDENAELATVDILEKRLESLARTAEEVTRSANRLVHALRGRRSGIVEQMMQQPQQPQQGQQPQSGGATGFQAVNRRKRKNSMRGGIGLESGDLHAELLQQFSSPSPSPSMYTRPIYAIQPGPAQGHIQVSTATATGQGAPPGAYMMASPTARRESAAEDAEALHRPLITSMIETLGKGDEIVPACDRCKRLKVECVKHLTACQGCTKKHAKCTWRMATEEEIAELKQRKEMRKRAVKKGSDGPLPGASAIIASVGGAGAVVGGHGIERDENSRPQRVKADTAMTLRVD
ncbi:unnamed protein product [Parascedosporium putredinis]|uniref:Zn(2)-C6 fungal-type domain-containing protein n=1 Tax=Parascedosporium putredinis TaxID=1442378 RepID=A0A9P1HAJ7_9PEZI|nr:unnamed protein product [Parascedosporium putredinis]CAI8001384.1 unnamed protein product [Parascedosporium putredinis]